MPADTSPGDANRAALARLSAIKLADIHYARIDETAIDVPTEEHDQGFVLQEYYDVGVLRESYFFSGTHRIPLTDEEIIVVANSAKRTRPYLR